MADKDVYIALQGVGQWLPVAPCGAVVVYDRGGAYGTSYEINCFTGDVRYTPGSIDGFRYILMSTNVYGGGDAPVTRQDYAVWGPQEKFPVITLGEGLGQGLRNSSYLTKNPFNFLPSYKNYTYQSYISCWKALDEFNEKWTAWNDWFIPSRAELMALINQTTQAGGSNLFGFLKWGWVEASSEYAGNPAQCADNALVTDGSEGSGADKLSAHYGRFYFRYIGGTGYTGLDSDTVLPTGVTGSIPLGYESLMFKRLESQSGGNTFYWGGANQTNQYFVQDAVSSFNSVSTGLSIGDGAKVSLILALGSSLGFTTSLLESNYMMENLFLFINRFSSQTNSFGKLSLNDVGFSQNGIEGAERIPFIPSRDELITVLNSSRGKGIFTEGEEFWSISDASATQAYSVTYHENSEPTVAQKNKTELLKCLVCYWKESLSDLPKVADPEITIESVATYDLKVNYTGQGQITFSPSSPTSGMTVTLSATSGNLSYIEGTRDSDGVGLDLQGTGNVRTFVMPSSGVHFNAYFDTKPITFLNAPTKIDFNLWCDPTSPYFFYYWEEESQKIYARDKDFNIIEFPCFGAGENGPGCTSLINSIIYHNNEYYLFPLSSNTGYKWNINTGECTALSVSITSVMRICTNPDVFVGTIANTDGSASYSYSFDLSSWSTIKQVPAQSEETAYFAFNITNTFLRNKNYVVVGFYDSVFSPTGGFTRYLFILNFETKATSLIQLDSTPISINDNGYPETPIDWSCIDNLFYIFGKRGANPNSLEDNSSFYYWTLGNIAEGFIAKEKSADNYVYSRDMSSYSPVQNYSDSEFYANTYTFIPQLGRFLTTPNGLWYNDDSYLFLSNSIMDTDKHIIFRNIGYGGNAVIPKESATAGEVLNISITTSANYSISNISLTNPATKEAVSYNSSTSGISFTMPSHDVYLQIEFSESVPCLDADAMVTLADGTEKKFRDLDDEDLLLVWDFDRGCYDVASILWKHEAHKIDWYWLLKTDKNREIKVIKNHRFFSPDLGRFERATNLVGHTVWTMDGIETVVSCERVEEPVEYCNAISFYHMNVIVGGFLTSCGFNNLYPIENMKYDKDSVRTRNTDWRYWGERGIPKRWFEGMRLDEQYSPENEIVSYIGRLL